MMSTLFELLSEVRWRPGIGDPHAMGWITTIAYFIAAGFCARAARRIGSPDDATPLPGNRKFWIILTFVMVVLGVNKQFDIQTLFTEIGRQLSIMQGWYGDRREVQQSFIAAIAIAGFISISMLVFLIRRAILRQIVALVGIVFLVCFVIIRASSFHKVDKLIGMSIIGIRVNWMLELSGILLVLIGSLIAAMPAKNLQSNAESGAF